MTLQPWLQIALTLLIGALISIPVGRYLARVVTDRTTFLDPVWDPVDNLIYRLIGQRICRAAMNWKSYTVHMLATNFVMAVMIYLILVFQDYLPLNPLHFPGMEPLLAFNTAVSFICNTDWQAYAGETTLSPFSQMAAITFPMFTSAATGFVVAMAFIRAFTVENGGADIGNFYRDLVRFTTRVLMPGAFVLGILLIQQGEPQTLDAAVTAHTIQGAGPDDLRRTGRLARDHQAPRHQWWRILQRQRLASLRKSDTRHQPSADALDDRAAGLNRRLLRPHDRQPSTGVGDLRRDGRVAAHLAADHDLAEQAGTETLAKAGIEMTATPGQPGGNMEGKEVRFGIAQSGLFGTITTTFTTGSVNAMHDSFTPLGAVPFFVGMMLQCVFGGKGVGFLAALVYGIIAVFVAGLMVGRTPSSSARRSKSPRSSWSRSPFCSTRSSSSRPLGGRWSRPTASPRWRTPARRLLRDPLRLQHFGRQQRLGIRGARCRSSWYNLATAFVV